MKTLTADKAIENFPKVFSAVVNNKKVFRVTHENKKAVILSEKTYLDLVKKIEEIE
ncbi:hypothetical protein [Mammaliicoccus sciuri]|uniref:hypothetical protein n=1 Tax=Mammaliicoccus sciuri TaxID=1296 RepID=UPI002B25F736|nr:hypothetical protein [Mammaliicoccus sciuri]WQK75261.1 hypothetical protein P3U33_05885 [Mammaliicoccus sciuri]